MIGRGKRRWLGLFLLGTNVCFAQPTQTQISFEAIIQKARERAEKPFQPAKKELPEALTKLNYDTYREIQFRQDKALWAKENLPFRLEFFHPGYLYETPVKIHEFTATHEQPIRFVADFFDYGKLKLDKKLSADSGYAGFRLLYRLNAPDRWDEVASMLGASYFRMLGKNQRYGASARGLAINSGEPGVKEEFPVFTEWWLGKPDKDVNTLRFYGLLDSVSCAGAYEFLLKPGDPTVADVNAVLFIRGGNGPALKTLGLAPITSMFWFGENSEAKPDDYRVEVHDSDGLLIRSDNDELTWRPLSNPDALRRQVFSEKNVRAFGLLQRDRDFSHYEDLFNLYHKTPSVWIEPRGNWGEGELHLVEIPTNFEGADNIVIFWNPAQKPVPMQPYRFGYTMHWALEPDAKLPPLRVVQTRIGAHAQASKKRQVMIDFSPGAGELSTKQPEVAASCGESAVVSDVQVAKNELSKTWRVIFSLTPKAETNVIVDIQCALKAGDKRFSEIWKYQWTPFSKKK